MSNSRVPCRSKCSAQALERLRPDRRPELHQDEGQDFDGNTALSPAIRSGSATSPPSMKRTGSTSAAACVTVELEGDFRAYNGATRRTDVLAETIFDAQVGYDFPDTSRLRGLSALPSGAEPDRRTFRDGSPGASRTIIAFLKLPDIRPQVRRGSTYKFAAPPPPPPPSPCRRRRHPLRRPRLARTVR